MTNRVLRTADVARFWLPLFSSWVLMTSEGPVISAFVNRLPDPVVMLAAMGIIFSIAVAIESPIINLLATSTALVRDLQSYRVMRRFTLHWVVGLTAIAALISLTPLFDLVVIDWLGTPDRVAVWVRPGLRWLIPWAGAIGWRRFLQGILISEGKTRSIAAGTALRLLISGGIATLGYAMGWPGVITGTVALLIGVLAEALYATWAVRPLLRDRLPERLAGTEPLTYKELLQFHLPLASTAVLTLLLQPIVYAFLARLDRPVDSLAAWPIIFQFMLLARAGAFALPEVVISLAKQPANQPALRRFSLSLATGTLVLLAVFALSPLANLYLGTVQKAPPVVAELALLGLMILIPLPATATLTSWFRGLLIHHSRTGAVNRAMIVRLATSITTLLIGLFAGWPGIVTVGCAANLSNLAELGSLARRYLTLLRRGALEPK